MQVAYPPNQLASSPGHGSSHASSPIQLETTNTSTALTPAQEDSQDDDDDHARSEAGTDLGEVVDLDDYLSTDEDALNNLSDSDDSDMAKQIEAAAESESLLGSDGSSDEAHLEKEEQYIIDDAISRKKSKYERPGSSNSDEALDDDSRMDAFDTEKEHNFEEDDEFWNTLSPSRTKHGDAVIENEMFKPQRGFATSPEPSFSDFFGSSDEMEEAQVHDDDDDEMLTTDEDTESVSDSSSTISNASLSAPLIAHFSTTRDRHGDEGDGDDPATDEDEDGSLRSAIPLLVIEDLDGRLIYARAGDGEAVFGSDGEFEFAGESDEDVSSDDMGEYEHQPMPRLDKGLNKSQFNDVVLSDADTQSLDTGDDGDTTDELPDEDMPYPRLLIGSIAPRGGRNARRAREIAARSRMSSPRVLSPAPGLPGPTAASSSRAPSSLSNVLSAADADSESSDAEDEVDYAKRPTSTASTGEAGGDEASARGSPRKHEPDAPGFTKPEMGQFIPAFSKSVHRAVIDGSHRAPSPFSSQMVLQRGFGKKRTTSKPGMSEDSLEHALSVPSRLKRKRSLPSHYHSPSFVGMSQFAVQPDQGQNPDSSPEPGSPELGNTMDLGDVLDENLIWEEASSESGSDGEQSSWSGKPTDNKSRGRSKRQSDLGRGHAGRGPGLNYNAFARWNRIPMGAFRDSQKQSSAAVSPPMSNVYANHQRPTGTFLLTHPYPSSKRQFLSNAITPPARNNALLQAKEQTPFRRASPNLSNPQNLVSPLNRTLADSAVPQGSPSARSPLDSSLAWMPSAGSSSSEQTPANIGDHTVVGGNFLVSPMLMPVKHSGRNGSTANLGAPSAAGPFPHSRKVTKREKREKKARREAMKRERSLDQFNLRSGDNPSPTPQPSSAASTVP